MWEKPLQKNRLDDLPGVKKKMGVNIAEKRNEDL